MPCYSCGEDTLLEVDGARTVCTRCGTVLEENAIVSEITFGETGGGAAMVQGSYVGQNEVRARAPAGYRQQGGGQESREQTMLNGRKRIQTLAIALRLPDRIADSGQRYFNLAVNMSFTKGRRTQYVVAACLYSACRMDKTSHMLIDFSDLLEINVFVLGSTYLKLVKELSLQLPTVDPSLYISRFAALLEFGDETQKVAQDAVRLVARMGRDWMHIGRRPAGVCGACLLLAARMNNFRRSITEVVQVVKIADVTLRKRLDEFRETPSGALTVADFRTLWLDETADPPAFSRNQRKEKLAREAEEQKARALPINAYKGKGKGKEKEKLFADESDDEEGSEAEGAGDDSLAGQEAFAELAAVDGEPGSPGDAPQQDDEEQEGDMAPPPVPSAKALGKRKRKERDVDEEEEEVEEPHFDAPELDDAIAKEMDVIMGSEGGQKLTDELDKRDSKRIETAAAMTNLTLDTSERLDDLDEDELDAFILTPAEIEAKSRLWMQINKDYLQQLADKQTGPDGELRPVAARRVRKRNKPRDSTTASGDTAADAAKQMLVKKRFSKKINYAAIDSLFNKAPSSRATSLAPSSVAGSVAGGSDDEEDDDESRTKFTFVTNDSRSGSMGPPGAQKRGPINVPRPTFRAGSSAAGSRAGSVRAESVVPEEEEEEEEEPEEEEEEWRKLANQHKGGEEDYGEY